MKKVKNNYYKKTDSSINSEHSHWLKSGLTWYLTVRIVIDYKLKLENAHIRYIETNEKPDLF